MALNEFDPGSAPLDRRIAGGESSDLAASRRQRRRRAAAAAWNAAAAVTSTAVGVPSAEVGMSTTGLGEVRGRAGLVRLLYKPAEAGRCWGSAARSSTSCSRRTRSLRCGLAGPGGSRWRLSTRSLRLVRAAGCRSRVTGRSPAEPAFGRGDRTESYIRGEVEPMPGCLSQGEPGHTLPESDLHGPLCNEGPRVGGTSP